MMPEPSGTGASRPGRITHSEEFDWLAAALVDRQGDRHRVDEILPGGYERYLRVLDPWHPADSTTPRHTWRSLASVAGVQFYAAISWHELDRATRRGRPHLYSGPDLETRQRVVAHLRETSTGPFLFAFELVASVLLDLEPPVVIEADRLDLDGVRQATVVESGSTHPLIDDPEHWWPRDRSWVVNRDYDLDELYVACGHALAETLLGDPSLEVVEVALTSRVDWTVDDDRRIAP